MTHNGRASSAALSALLGVLVGAALVWFLAPRALGVRRPPNPPAAIAQPGAPSAASQDAITAAVEKVGRAVVNISVLFQPRPQGPMQRMLGIPTEPFPRPGQGSGVVIDGKRGYILTNAHVVRNAQKVVVALADGRRLDAHVVGLDPLTEVAVVKVSANDLPEAPMGSAEQLPIGSWVIAIGNPFGLENSVTVGVLSAKGRQIGGPNELVLQDLLQTDASINPGNSGGALVDLQGNLVGIPTAVIPYAQGIGFAVSVDVAREVAERLIQTGKMPWLGIEHRELLPQEAKQVGAPAGKGTMVFGVVPNGPAAQAGIRPGDLIVRVGDQTVGKAADLTKAIRAHNAGDHLDITIIRKGKQMTLPVTLGAVPPTLGQR